MVQRRCRCTGTGAVISDAGAQVLVQRFRGFAVVQVSQRCRVLAQSWCRGAEMQRCRNKGVEVYVVQRCRCTGPGAVISGAWCWCRGAEGGCRDEEVQRGYGVWGMEEQRSRGAEVQR